MLEEFVGEKVVVDFTGEYVAFGTLKRFDEHFLELKNADLHDLRDTDSTRENYIAASVRTGIKRNRKKVIVNRSEIVAVSKLDDFVDV
jgi:small nuclear ribonucleoprotein (snRNP)-like protein